MRNQVKNRKGLTMIELVVVLTILVALAGIVVPLLPSMVSHAHTAAHATNVVEIDKIVEAYNMLNHGYPDNLDSLVAGGAGAAFTRICPAQRRPRPPSPAPGGATTVAATWWRERSPQPN